MGAVGKSRVVRVKRKVVLASVREISRDEWIPIADETGLGTVPTCIAVAPPPHSTTPRTIRAVHHGRVVQMGEGIT